MPRFSKRLKRNLLALVVLAIGLGLFFCWQMGGALCGSANRSIKAPGALPVEAVTFSSASGATIHGWVVSATGTNRGVVILQHGWRADRLQMANRARFLSAAGYNVLLFDFQGHGESIGKTVTFGYLESRDSQAAVEFMKKRFPSQPVGIIGISLGGAAALLAQPPLDVQALVLEEVYPDIVDATKDRLEMVIGRPARMLSPLLTCQVRLRLGISAAVLRPIDHVSETTIPRLFLHGTKDRRTHFSEAEQIFAHASEPKQFFPVEGADHEDLHKFLGAQYEQLILTFLGEHLK